MPLLCSGNINSNMNIIKEILHGNMNSNFYVDSITKMLAARPDNGVRA